MPHRCLAGVPDVVALGFNSVGCGLVTAVTITPSGLWDYTMQRERTLKDQEGLLTRKSKRDAVAVTS